MVYNIQTLKVFQFPSFMNEYNRQYWLVAYAFPQNIIIVHFEQFAS